MTDNATTPREVTGDITFAAINDRLAIRRDRQTVALLDAEVGAVQLTARQACRIGERLGWTNAGFNDAGYLELGYALLTFGPHTILDQEEARQQRFDGEVAPTKARDALA